MRRFCVAIVVVACALGARAASSETRRDNIADLDSLAAQRSWSELGDHLQDIPPTARDAHWQALVEQAAVGELTPYAQAGGSFGDKLAVLERYYPTFPSLAQSAPFLALRATIGLDAFGRCFDRANARRTLTLVCREKFEEFVRTAPIDATLARQAAEIVAVKLTPAEAAPFYAVAGGGGACAAPGLADAAIAALAQPVDGPEAKAGRVLLVICWERLKPAALEAFGGENAGSLFMQNACPTLMAHDALSGLRAQRCRDLARNEPPH